MSVDLGNERRRPKEEVAWGDQHLSKPGLLNTYIGIIGCLVLASP